MNYATLCRSAVVAALVLLTTNGYAQQWRLKAQIDEDPKAQGSGYIYEVNDSLQYDYSYSHNRGSGTSLYYNDIPFDSYQQYHFKPGSGYELKRSLIRTYDNNDHKLTEQDRTLYVAGWHLVSEDTLSYDASGNLSVWKRWRNVAGVNAPSVLVQKEEKRYTYNAQNLITAMNEYTSPGAGQPFTNIRQHTYSYNGGNLETLHRVRVPKNGTWVDESAYITTYTNGMRSKTEDSRFSLGYAIITYYMYNGAGQRIKDSITSSQATGSGALMNIYTYNAQGLLATDTQRYTNRVQSVDVYEYTATGLLSVDTRYSVDANGQYVPSKRYRYQYEAYWPVSVSQAVHNSNDVILYPNPATTELRISGTVQWQQGRIYNSMGQMVQIVNANGKQVDISRLPAGNYYLQLTANGEVLNKSFTIVR